MRKTLLKLPLLALAMGIMAFGQSDRYDERDRVRDRADFRDTIPAGTNIEVRTNDYIDIRDASDGRIYNAAIARDVLDRDGRVVIPRGAAAELIVRNVDRNNLALDLESINVNGRRYIVSTADQPVSGDRGEKKEGIGKNNRTGRYVGGGAAIGAIIGAIAGGGKGAAIGAIAGGGAGAGAQVLTRGKSVRVPAESLLTFRLDQPLTIGGPDTGVDRDGHHYHYRQ